MTEIIATLDDALQRVNFTKLIVDYTTLKPTGGVMQRKAKKGTNQADKQKGFKAEEEIEIINGLEALGKDLIKLTKKLKDGN